MWQRGGSTFGNGYVDVLSSRAANITYTNATGRHLFIMVSATSDDASARYMYAYVDGLLLANSKITEANGVSYQRLGNTLSFIAPPGGTYLITHSGGIELRQWVEL